MTEESTTGRGRAASILNPCPICGRDPWSDYFSGNTNFEEVFAPCECRLAEIEVEEDAELRSFRFEEWDFRSPGLEGVYTEFPTPGRGVVRPDLPDEAKRARELEARAYYLWSPRHLKGYFGRVLGKMAEDRVFMYRAKRPEDVPRHTVRAVRAVIDEMEPEWMARIAEARFFTDNPCLVARWCELPLQVVMAGLENLTAREKATNRPAG